MRQNIKVYLDEPSIHAKGKEAGSKANTVVTSNIPRIHIVMCICLHWIPVQTSVSFHLNAGVGCDAPLQS